MQPSDLSTWKLTLPTGAPSKPTEIKPPALATYSGKHFYATADGALVFIAPTDGVTTKNSKNPRSELRELNADGTLAAWSSTVDYHALAVELSVDVLQLGSKPHVVVAQIHDSDDDVTVFRVEGNADKATATIWITDDNSTRGYKLTDSYRIGDRITVGFHVGGGIVRYSFNGQPVDYKQTKKFSGAYFKTGCYNQAGGIITRLPDGSADFAKVTVYSIALRHEAAVGGGGNNGGSDLAQQVAALQQQVAALGVQVQACSTQVARLAEKMLAIGKAAGQ